MDPSLPVVLEDGGQKYVYGLGLAYAVQNVNGTERLQVYHADGLGSVRAISDSAGAIVGTYRTDEFGAPLESSGRLTQPYQYTGEPRDASGLVFLRARYYDPAIGRFTSRDRFRGITVHPTTLHRLSYAYNNPIRYIDPAGLSPAGLPAFPPGFSRADFDAILADAIFLQHYASRSRSAFQSVESLVFGYFLPGGRWDIKHNYEQYGQGSPEYQTAANLGNFLFGCVGTMLGHAPPLLHTVGNVDEQEKALLVPVCQHSGGQLPEGDCVADREWIDRGIAYAHSSGLVN